MLSNAAAVYETASATVVHANECRNLLNSFMRVRFVCVLEVLPARQHAGSPCHVFECTPAYPSPNPEVNRLERRWRGCADNHKLSERKPPRAKRAP